MDGQALLSLGVLLAGGMLAGRLCDWVGLPRVAGYVLAGAAFSADLLGRWVPMHVEQWSGPLTMAALGIVAYLVGGAITVGQLKRIGKVVLGGALGEAMSATIMVGLGVWLFGLLAHGGDAHIVLALGAMAATTDPAAPVAVVHEYRARGPLTQTLLGIAAVDDALGLIIFALIAAIGFGASVWQTLPAAGLHIAGALALGAVAGLVVVWVVRRSHNHVSPLPLVLSAILLLTGVADYLDISPLLTAMMLGFVCRSMPGGGAERLFAPVEMLEDLVFLMFFTVAGAHFRVIHLQEHWPLVLVYIVFRGMGKVGGASLAATVTGAPPRVRRWLGLGLIPQAGVAMGLALSIGQRPQFAQIADVIVNVVLAATLFHELVGPILVRLALGRAGELGADKPEQPS